MYDHIGLKVKDLARADASTKPRSHRSAMCWAPTTTAMPGIGPADAPALWLYAAKGAQGPGTHLAFRAPITRPSRPSTRRA
jgi:hypothetical protein